MNVCQTSLSESLLSASSPAPAENEKANRTALPSVHLPGHPSSHEQDRRGPWRGVSGAVGKGWQVQVNQTIPECGEPEAMEAPPQRGHGFWTEAWSTTESHLCGGLEDGRLIRTTDAQSRELAWSAKGGSPGGWNIGRQASRQGPGVRLSFLFKAE